MHAGCSLGRQRHSARRCRPAALPPAPTVDALAACPSPADSPPPSVPLPWPPSLARQVFRQLSHLPPVTSADEEALFTRPLPFRTFEYPGELHPGLRAYPFLAQVCRHWKDVLETKEALQTLWGELIVDFGHELITGGWRGGRRGRRRGRCSGDATQAMSRRCHTAASPATIALNPSPPCAAQAYTCRCGGATCGRLTTSSAPHSPRCGCAATGWSTLCAIGATCCAAWRSATARGTGPR